MVPVAIVTTPSIVVDMAMLVGDFLPVFFVAGLHAMPFAVVPCTTRDNTTSQYYRDTSIYKFATDILLGYIALRLRCASVSSLPGPPCEPAHSGAVWVACPADM